MDLAKDLAINAEGTCLVLINSHVILGVVTCVVLTNNHVILGEVTCLVLTNNHVILGEVIRLVLTNSHVILMEGTRMAIISSLAIRLEEIVLVITSNQVFIMTNLAYYKVTEIKIVNNKIHVDFIKVIVDPTIVIKQILIVGINSKTLIIFE